MSETVEINAGIVVLQDGSPCIICDTTLPGEVDGVEVCRDDFQVTLICLVLPPADSDDPFGAPKTGIQKISKIARKKSPEKKRIRLDYPLDPRFFNLLKRKEVVAIGTVTDKALRTLKIVPVVFTGT